MKTVTLPWPPKELSPNYKGKLRLMLRAKKAYKHACWAIGLEAGIKGMTPPLRFTYMFHPPAAYHYDDDNLAGRMKYARDMLAKVIGCDDKHITLGQPVIAEPRRPHGEVVVAIEPDDTWKPVGAVAAGLVASAAKKSG